MSPIKILRAFSKLPKSLCKRKTVWCEIFDETGNHVLRCCNTCLLNNPQNCNGDPCGCMHAETKAIMNLMALEPTASCYTMVCSYSPCTRCAQVMIHSRMISRVYYGVLTEHDQRGKHMLILAGIECDQIN